mmetsp:Transcript_20899/g.36731  ORF Transcript_20899/g.36731 Transcript_20899/m.36731 type:complete len:224 (+) Transcript_20899:3-674(+)
MKSDDDGMYSSTTLENFICTMTAPQDMQDVLSSSMRTTTTTTSTDDSSLSSCSSRKRRSVTFNEQVRIQPIQPIQSLLSLEEQYGEQGATCYCPKQALWFQKDEYQTIWNKTTALVRFVMKNGNKKHYCLRGLETLMEPIETLEHRKHAWNVVLSEQRHQRCSNSTSDGHHDGDRLAFLYRLSSMTCNADALTRAQQDSIVAKAYCNSYNRGSSTNTSNTKRI